MSHLQLQLETAFCSSTSTLTAPTVLLSHQLEEIAASAQRSTYSLVSDPFSPYTAFCSNDGIRSERRLASPNTFSDGFWSCVDES